MKRIAPVSTNRRPIAKARAGLTRTMAAFLDKQRAKILGQIIVLRGERLWKAELSQDEQDAIDAIIAGIDFEGWAVLVGDAEPILEEVVKDQAYAALASVGIDVEARPEVMKIVDERAIAYARERSAEMVGMRRDELGRLVENPLAEWAITEPTRDSIRADVTQAIEDGWSNDRLSAALEENYGFSKERAMTIARTETNYAASQGALEGYKASGVVAGKVWLTAEDDLVSEECEANADAGVIGLDEDFPSGDDAPPAHPNCRCAIAPAVIESEQPTEPEPAAETED